MLLAWVGFYFLVDWRGNIGQREHLFVLLYVPYLVLRVLRHREGTGTGATCAKPPAGRRTNDARPLCPTPLSVLLGIQAGFGSSLKPYFLLAAVAVECFLTLSSTIGTRRRIILRLSHLHSPRSSPPENIALAGIVAAYLLHWSAGPGSDARGFFGRWVPLICRGYHAVDVGYRECGRHLADPVAA